MASDTAEFCRRSLSRFISRLHRHSRLWRKARRNESSITFTQMGKMAGRRQGGASQNPSPWASPRRRPTDLPGCPRDSVRVGLAQVEKPCSRGQRSKRARGGEETIPCSCFTPKLAPCLLLANRLFSLLPSFSPFVSSWLLATHPSLKLVSAYLCLRMAPSFPSLSTGRSPGETAAPAAAAYRISSLEGSTRPRLPSSPFDDSKTAATQHEPEPDNSLHQPGKDADRLMQSLRPEQTSPKVTPESPLEEVNLERLTSPPSHRLALREGTSLAPPPPPPPTLRKNDNHSGHSHGARFDETVTVLEPGGGGGGGAGNDGGDEIKSWAELGSENGPGGERQQLSTLEDIGDYDFDGKKSSQYSRRPSISRTPSEYSAASDAEEDKRDIEDDALYDWSDEEDLLDSEARFEERLGINKRQKPWGFKR